MKSISYTDGREKTLLLKFHKSNFLTTYQKLFLHSLAQFNKLLLFAFALCWA